jgi:gamma-glutamylcyclotransferase (GGCT)/AIG2-like uncharacterized protein YtfP
MKSRPSDCDKRPAVSRKKRAVRSNQLPAVYFAYGSNMNHDQMQVRCPTAKYLGPFYLQDWSLLIRYHATVIPDPGSRVAGALWQVESSDVQALDRYEGVDYYYKRTVMRQQGVDFFFYEMIDTGEGWPSHSYLHSIEQGYQHCGIPLAYFKPLLQGP